MFILSIFLCGQGRKNRYIFRKPVMWNAIKLDRAREIIFTNIEYIYILEITDLFCQREAWEILKLPVHKIRRAYKCTSHNKFSSDIC